VPADPGKGPSFGASLIAGLLGANSGIGGASLFEFASAGAGVNMGRVGRVPAPVGSIGLSAPLESGCSGRLAGGEGVGAAIIRTPREFASSWSV
jgi:hypothetical protein